METAEATRRLAFIKYLYDVAVEQSQKPEPSCSASILAFHDSIELFLQLASEFLDAKKDSTFMGYWDLLKPCLELRGKEGLTQKTSIGRLNDARVQLKHHGHHPSKFDIQDFRTNARTFFEENTPIVFGLQFADISLIELVKCEAAKNSLKEADKLKGSKTEDALDKVAIAFAQLIDDYENRKKDEFGRSPFFFGEPSSFTDYFMKFDNEMGSFVTNTNNSIRALQDSVKILSLGIDYRKYAKFRLLTPIIIRIPFGTYNLQRIRLGYNVTPQTEDVQFCIDFVIECAIALQEFDFSLQPSETMKWLKDVFK